MSALHSSLIPNKDFTPTFLYIKQHSVNKKLYFGKTIQNPETYLGSGTHWRRHIKKHGKEHVETLWYCLFFDKETIFEFALMFSEQQNIVESNDWLNIIPENGIDGACPGVPKSDESKRKMSIAKLGVLHTKEHNAKIAIHSVGENNGMFEKKHSEETKLKMSIAKKDVPLSEETKLKMSIAKKGVPRPPHSEETKLKMSIAKKGVPKCGQNTKVSRSLNTGARVVEFGQAPVTYPDGMVIIVKN